MVGCVLRFHDLMAYLSAERNRFRGLIGLEARNGNRNQRQQVEPRRSHSILTYRGLVGSTRRVKWTVSPFLRAATTWIRIATAKSTTPTKITAGMPMNVLPSPVPAGDCKTGPSQRGGGKEESMQQGKIGQPIQV